MQLRIRIKSWFGIPSLSSEVGAMTLFPSLIVEKARNGFVNRYDIHTYVELHDADEGRIPKNASGSADTFA
jgi:hypothetical protein